MKNTIYVIFIFIVITITSLSACSPYKQVAYFKDIPNRAINKNIQQITYEAPIIQSGDVLRINVQTRSSNADQLLGTQAREDPWVAETNYISQKKHAGYLVDANGFIELPLIGMLEVKGKTTANVQQIIYDLVVKYYNNPTVYVYIANFKITVLGEVARPASYIMDNEKVTLLDALSIAGDLTIYGKRENVLLTREINGKRTVARLNLTDSKLFVSPFWYLRQNDIIYVEPNKSKMASIELFQTKYFPLISSTLSLLLLAISALRR